MAGNPKGRVFVVALVLLTFFRPAAVRGQKEPPADAAGELEKIARTYKIEIVRSDPSFPVKTTYGAIDGKGAGKKEVQEYAGLFAPEFALYPTDLIKRSQLKRVVLCDDLSFAGQRRNAIPDYEHDTLYLD